MSRTPRPATFLADDGAATAIEYALVATILSLAVLAAILVLGASLDQQYQGVGQTIEQATLTP